MLQNTTKMTCIQSVTAYRWWTIAVWFCWCFFLCKQIQIKSHIYTHARARVRNENGMGLKCVCTSFSNRYIRPSAVRMAKAESAQYRNWNACFISCSLHGLHTIGFTCILVLKWSAVLKVNNNRWSYIKPKTWWRRGCTHDPFLIPKVSAMVMA